WQVQASPFRLTFVKDGKSVTSQAPADVAGPGGRMSYRVGGTCCATTGSATYHLTDLIDQAPVDGGTAYTVATDEPGRTATVTVTPTPQGARVHWALSTSDTPVTVLYESFNDTDGHYLSGSSATAIDLRGKIRGWRPGKEGRHADNYCQNQEEVS